MKRLGLLGLAMMLGCSDIFGFDTLLEYPTGERYSDDAMFRPLWDELEKCSRLNRRFSDVEFYSVPARTLGSESSFRILGLYFPKTDRIFVVEASIRSPEVIRHEMMHALLRKEGGHPPLYFGEDGLCGAL